MTEIKPFRALIYNRGIIKDYKKVVCPPYDIISPPMQKALYELSDYNAVRLELGKEGPLDKPSDNRYTRAKDTINEWIKNSVLVFDKKPAIYLYRQDYKYKKRPKTQLGFMALIRLSDSKRGGVLKHEKTFSGPKKDRFKLLNSTHANISPIFSLYFDERQCVKKILNNCMASREPFADAQVDGIRNRMWRIADIADIKRIRKCMRDKKIFIADGHHRYEVAVAYKNEMRKRALADAADAFAYVMMYFAGLDEDMTILATHRVIKNIKFDEKNIIRNFKPFFEIEELKSAKRLHEHVENSALKHVFGMYLKNKKAFLLKLKDAKTADLIVKTKMSKEWKRLDVSILHEFILGHILNFKKTDESNIIYARDAELAIDMVNRRKADMAFLLKATKISQITRIASLGERMPHKSTYFYPKLLSGFVINRPNGSLYNLEKVRKNGFQGIKREPFLGRPK